ncbi:MAG: ABC transporter ATP-binding protein [Candidatus Omnitrophica bacterium]|nr:ABC transporter ATP-binding protein [Candidatus Omnitrophota bacterium]
MAYFSSGGNQDPGEDVTLSDIAVRCEHAGKKFCKSLKKSMLYGGLDIFGSVFGAVPDSTILRPEEFWAVDEVSFELKRGESFGIIGPNGSGKSTLLKMLNGIFMPDKGRITVNGKMGALIQVGAGFHPMLSGRENIYINGAILGMTKKELDRKFDSIVDFADISDFLDSPVKFYSSGMYVRLGFAIAVHCEPDILLIDEILAVGDKAFQIKCYQRMHEIKKKGTTIILVSHNEYVVREHTGRCLYLNHGKQRSMGPSEETINVYIKDVYEQRSQQRTVNNSQDPNKQKYAEIIGLKFCNVQGRETSFIESGAALDVFIEFMVHEDMDKPILGVNFYADDGALVYGANSHYEQFEVKEFLRGPHSVKIHIPHFYLPTNDYLCSVVVAQENVGNLIDWHDSRYKLVVGRAPNARGLLKLPTQWEILK